MRDIPRPFEIYRHFKGNCYQILTMAQDAGDGRRLVVYQALYGDLRVYVRELGEFLSPVDQKKYPAASQYYRFEKVDRIAEESVNPAEGVNAAQHEDAAKSVNGDVHAKAETSVNADVLAKAEKSVNADGHAKAETSVNAAVLAKAETSINPAEGGSVAETVSTAKAVQEAEPDLDPAVLEFLEAETYEQRLNILASVKHRITDDMLNTMSIAADVEVEPGPVEERFNSLKNALLMKDRFERVRLR